MMPDSTASLTPAAPATPAGSPKTPALRASMGIACRISSSETETNAPPDSVTALIPLLKLRGCPTAMESARVLASHGIRLLPSFHAVKKGLHPSACTPRILGKRGMKPRMCISLSPFHTPPIVQPSPTLTTTQSGKLPGVSVLNCSANSRETVFLPSIRYGLMAQLRLYQPNSAAAAMHNSHASS